MVYMADQLQQMLGSLADFNYIPYGVYRIAMKLRYIQKKTRLCHVTMPMWKRVVEEHCLENPNLVLQPAEISSVVTSLLQAVAQEVGDEIMINEDECARLMLSWLSILYPQSTLTSLQLNIPIILLSNSDTMSKHRMLFEMTRLSGYELSLQQLSHMLHLSSYLIISCAEQTVLGSSASQNVAQHCYAYSNISFHRSIRLEQYEKWIQSDPEYLAWIPTLYRLNISHSMKHEAKCGVCKCYPILGLRYRCLKCVNLDLCQECFLKGVVYKNHDEKHPLKEYIRQGTRSESIKDLTALVKTYFKPKSSKGSTRAPSEGRPKSTISYHDSLEYGTVGTEEWFARKGRLPQQSPLQYTSCPSLHLPEDRRMELLQKQTDQLVAQVDRLRQEVSMNSPPPYHTHSDLRSLAQSSYYEVISEAAPTSLPPSQHLYDYPTRPLSPLQTIAEIADTFTTDLGLYSGDDRERHPVISGAGQISVAMDTFLTDMFTNNKTPPPKPKRTSPNLSKASSTPPSSRNSTPSHSGIDLHLAFDPQNKTQPGYILSPTKPSRPDHVTSPLYQQIYSSTPRLPKKQTQSPPLDISFTCSSILDSEGEGGGKDNGREERTEDGRGEGRRGGQKHQLKRLIHNNNNTNNNTNNNNNNNNCNGINHDHSVLARRRHSDHGQTNGQTNGHTDRHSLADSSITRSIRKVYHPPPLPLLRAVESAGDISGRGEQRSGIVRNYRGSMDLSFHMDSTSELGGIGNHSLLGRSNRTLHLPLASASAHV